MSEFPFPPGLVLFLGAFLLPQVQGKARTALVLGLPLLALVLIWSLPAGSTITLQFLQYALEPVSATAVGRLFATVFALAAFAGGLYGLWRAEPDGQGGYQLREGNVLELGAAYAYAGSAIGVTFAGDLITLFIFWELMALSSTLVLWSNSNDNPKAYGASMRYLLVHLAGGVILMGGIVWQVYASGSTAFVNMSELDSGAHWLIMAGFLINAGAPPLSAWVADAYPEASPSGMVFLSAFTTKTAVYVLLVGFAGAQVLIYIGLYMVFYGIFYALMENDMRRILAYSIVNQVGFMVTAIGIGSALALNGAAAHAFAHIIYKALMLMSAGSVLALTGQRKCTELGGLFRYMPLTAVFGIIGSLAIAAFPFTSGFVTKSLETSAAAYAGLVPAWFLLLTASAGAILYIGFKFPWFVFFNRDSGLHPPEAPRHMLWAMGFCAFLSIGIGVFPEPLYALLPHQPVDYQAYTIDHLVTQFQLLLFAAAAFFLLLPQMQVTPTISLDFDWFYRKLLKYLAREFSLKTMDARRLLEHRTLQRTEKMAERLYHRYGPQSVFARTWPSGVMVLWVAVLLAGSLVLYYLR
ncbi:MAG: Na(+)/H(+) antiporter subunit D [Thiothrix sp.]|nr:Na(+)/H(+) antiporter subunit D [Thiothrix sp.]